MMLLLLMMLSVVGCHGNQNCVWTWGEWNSCVVKVNNQNSTTQENLPGTRDRIRLIDQLPDLGKGKCPDDVIETQQCTGTPLDARAPPYCSQPDMTSCNNGYCITSDLWCNSDDDCLDNSDESKCTSATRGCDLSVPTLPLDGSWGRGFDHVTGKFKGHLMNEGFKGSCDSLRDGSGQSYRRPFNVESYRKAMDSSVNTRLMESWDTFIKHVIRKYPFPLLNSQIAKTFSTFANQSVFVESTLSITKELITLKKIGLLPHHELHRDIHELPSVFQYLPYFKFIDKYGTHFSRDIHIGGEINIIIAFDACIELDHSKLTHIRDKLHRSLESHKFAAIDYESFFLVIYNDKLVTETSDFNRVKRIVDNQISTLTSDSYRGERFIHHDRKGVDEEQIHQLLESEHMKGIPHIIEVKNNLIRATNEYLSQFNKSHCPHCQSEALIGQEITTLQDGCLCMDLSTAYNLSACPPIAGGQRNLALPIIVGVIAVVLVIFIFLIAIYTKNTYKKPAIKKPFAPVGSIDGLKHASGIASLPDGHILVTDFYHVYRFNPVGEEVTSTKKREITLSKPRGVTYHPSYKTVFVCEYAKNSLTSLGPNLDGVKKRRNLPGSPIDVVTTQNGNLVVIMEINVTRVVEMMSANPEEGSIVRWSHESLVQPSHLAVGYSNVVLTDPSSGQVYKFTPNGMKYEDFNCQIESPQGLCCLPDGRYLVCWRDNEFDQIAVLDPDGHKLSLKANYHRKGQSGELKNIICNENMGHIALLFDNQILVYKLDDFVSNIKSIEAPKSPLATMASRV